MKQRNVLLFGMCGAESSKTLGRRLPCRLTGRQHDIPPIRRRFDGTVLWCRRVRGDFCQQNNVPPQKLRLAALVQPPSCIRGSLS